MDIALLRQRANIIQKTRAFFNEKNYLETDTPILSSTLIPESCLEVFETLYLPPQKDKAQSLYLVPSPEIWLKKIIADHHVNIYQISKCFRNGESVGRIHSPEFTMLEYYTMDADYIDSLSITEDLFYFLLPQNAPPYLFPPFERITIEEAFSRFAGFDLFSAVEKNTLKKEAQKLGLIYPPDIKTDDLYNLIFVHIVEPFLPKEKPIALLDYPEFVPCLAKKHDNRKTVERWELYVRGIELANCYSEETNINEVKNYFESEGKIKEASAIVPHKVDLHYYKIFQDFPKCSGVALGMDRLIMLLTEKLSIDSVIHNPTSTF